MNYRWTYARAAILRNPYRTLGMLLGTLLAIGLLSAVLFYVDASAAHMTQAAIADVPVDMQVIATGADTQLATLQSQLAMQPSVTGVTPFSLTSFTSGQLTGDRATATTAGALLAVEPDYFTLFVHPQIIQGEFVPHGVLISKDMATNLGAKPGDLILLHFAAPAPPFTTTVSGIVNLAGADLLFAPTDAQHRQAAFNPPTNVVIMPLALFNSQLRARLLATPVQPAANGVVSANTLPVIEQLHIRIDHTQLPGDPLQAQTQTEQLRRRLEQQAPGQITVLNNLNDVIEKVKGDILWAKILVVFLAGPGILLAAYLSRYATANLIAAQRRELALLRARGATPEQVMGISLTISAIIALTGVVLGLVLGLATVVVATLRATNVAVITIGNWTLLLHSALVALVAGVLFALGAIILPTRSLYLAEVQTGRRQLVLESGRPLWQRFYLDWLCLLVGLVILFITHQNGFAPVVNGEGNATLSLSLFTFLSPTLIWLGAALLLLRLSDRWLRASAGGLARLLRVGFGQAGAFAARGIARRYRPLQQVALIIALAVAFGVSLSGFAATYRQQQQIDAELTLGAAVRVTPAQGAPQTATFADQLRATPGVAAVSPFDINVGYVGSELQDLFGVNVASLRQSTTVADSFFLSGPADVVLNKLAATPNGIIVSEETARDYSIIAGDHMNIRLQRAQEGAFVTVNFEVVGVAREFPTAPQDSFLVANQAFLHQQTGSTRVTTFLVRATGDPAQLAAALQVRFSDPRLKIEAINNVTARLTSTLTTLSLEALTRIEWLYTLLIAALALTIFLFSLLAERATEYATLAALGATPRQVNAFVLAEASVSGLAGIIIGSVVGLGLTQVLVTILAAIFDPPPTWIVLPLDAIGLLVGLMGVGLAFSMVIVITVLQHRAPAQVLRNV